MPRYAVMPKSERAGGGAPSCLSTSVVEFVEAGGLKIAYERVGEGPPLVLVHGAAEDSRMWQPQLAGLADEFTVVAWDEPGLAGPPTCRRASTWRASRTGSQRCSKLLRSGPRTSLACPGVEPWCSSSTAAILGSSRP